MGAKAGVPNSVSVVITTFNHAKYLGPAIDSVQKQTVRPVEIIVVDDGSTDNPASVTALYPEVHLIRQANQGLAAARNTGWRAASGTYVLFVDADDLLLPRAIQSNLVQFAAHPKASFVYGAYRLIDEAGNLIRNVSLQPVGEDAYATFLKGNCIGMHATVVYRRDRLEEVGGFDANLRACEDYDLYLRMARRFHVACSSEAIADYRQHGENMSRDIPMMLRTVLMVLRRQEEYARSEERWTQAFAQGIVGWKMHYAAVYLGNVRRLFRGEGSYAVLARQAIGMLRAAPGALLAIGIKRLAHLTRKQLERRKPRMGDLRRTTPFSGVFGYDRGKPIDRRYIEAFLESNAADIKGRVLEIGDSTYTRRFGGERVNIAEVFNRHAEEPQTTYFGDLGAENNLPSDAFDCIIITQTLQFIFNVPEAVHTLHRALRPGGVLLVTVPWITPIDGREEWRATWYWSISPAGLRRLVAEQFSVENIRVSHYGNVLSATAFLYGLGEHELSLQELDTHDEDCAVVVAARAEKRI